MLNYTDGSVEETRGHLSMVRGNRLVTPPLARRGGEGVPDLDPIDLARGGPMMRLQNIGARAAELRRQ